MVSLKDKIGQMLVMGFRGTEPAIVVQGIGGVILFEYNIQSPQQLKALTEQLQADAEQPLLISIDYEGGRVNRLKEKAGFPPTLSAADIALGSDEQARQYAEQMAKTLKAAGINVNFAPVLDVNVNPQNPVMGQLGRSFSSDPQEVIHYAGLFAKACQDHGIVCAYKHFPGHGSSTADTHVGFVDVTDTWQAYELEPFKQLLQQPHAYPMVMTAHVVHRGLDPDGYPASLSAAITTGLLRETLHFDGVVVTDDLQMKAISDNYVLKDAVRLVVNAGADLLIFGNQLSPTPQDPQEIVAIIHEAVVAGAIPESRIDEAYRRIMTLKGFLI